jgi:hypothetical protein
MGNLISTTDQREAHMTEKAQEEAKKASDLAQRRREQLESVAQHTDVGKKIIGHKKALEDSLKY